MRVGLTAVQQQVLGHRQWSVVRRRFDLEQFTHQRVDVDAVERLRQKVLLEVWSEGPEDGLHVHLSVMEAVVAFVDVDDESLVGNKQNYNMWGFLHSHPALPLCLWLLWPPTSPGLLTELGTFKGTVWSTSVLPSTDSHSRCKVEFGICWCSSGLSREITNRGRCHYRKITLYCLQLQFCTEVHKFTDKHQGRVDWFLSKNFSLNSQNVNM